MHFGTEILFLHSMHCRIWLMHYPMLFECVGALILGIFVSKVGNKPNNYFHLQNCLLVHNLLQTHLQLPMFWESYVSFMASLTESLYKKR